MAAKNCDYCDKYPSLIVYVDGLFVCSDCLEEKYIYDFDSSRYIKKEDTNT